MPEKPSVLVMKFHTNKPLDRVELLFSNAVDWIDISLESQVRITLKCSASGYQLPETHNSVYVDPDNTERELSIPSPSLTALAVDLADTRIFQFVSIDMMVPRPPNAMAEITTVSLPEVDPKEGTAAIRRVVAAWSDRWVKITPRFLFPSV